MVAMVAMAAAVAAAADSKLRLYDANSDKSLSSFLNGKLLFLSCHTGEQLGVSPPCAILNSTGA